jgi:HEAT repeat protein
MSKQAFEAKLEAVRTLSRAEPSAAVEPLRKMLSDRNNYLVSKAAAVVAGHQLQELVPNLLAAFDRFMKDPLKTDPQCWAKIAIAKALVQMDHTTPDLLVRGVGYAQIEPSYGGSVDTATDLRATCALGLVSTTLDSFDILELLTEALMDREKPVRVEAVRAIGHLNRPEGLLLLKLKALAGDQEPEVLANCFAILLELGGEKSISFLERFLTRDAEDEAALEAAVALAASKEPAALERIQSLWKQRLPQETREAIVVALGASPLRDAGKLLLSIVESSPADLAAAAVAALASSRFRKDVRDELEKLVALNESAEVQRAWDRYFKSND